MRKELILKPTNPVLAAELAASCYRSKVKKLGHFKMLHRGADWERLSCSVYPLQGKLSGSRNLEREEGGIRPSRPGHGPGFKAPNMIPLIQLHGHTTLVAGSHVMFSCRAMCESPDVLDERMSGEEKSG